MISRQHLHKIRSAVADIFGWSIKEDQLGDLERGLLETARELGILQTSSEIEKWLKNISWTKKELDILSTHLTVGETYFFREEAWLDVFKNQIIPEIIRDRRGMDQQIRIWSAGCCSGEEPYTLAILLNEVIPDLQNWNVTILGTDINRIFLAKAEIGKYTSWSFRETSELRKNHFFSQTGEAWLIDPRIKNLVTFGSLNLAEDHYPSEVTNTKNMDVIFCRNVLMYFTPEQIRNVTQRLYQSLNENGWLIVSVTELNPDFFTNFNAVKFGSCCVYQKPRKIVKQIKNTDSLDIKPQPFFNNIPKRSPQPTAIEINSSFQDSIRSVEDIKIAEQIAVTLFNKGQYEQCASECESILTKGTFSIEILTMLVRAKANNGLLDEAMHWAQKLALQPDVSADHFYLIANIMYEKNEISSAQEALKRALYLDPHHLMSHFLSGNISRQRKNKNGALKHFQNVMELLDQYEDESLVAGSEGMTAGRLRSIVSKLK